MVVISDIRIKHWVMVLECMWWLHSSPAQRWDISTIDLYHKSNKKSSNIYSIMHHFGAQACIFLFPRGALWGIGLVHCGICKVGLLANNQHLAYLFEITRRQHFIMIILHISYPLAEPTIHRPHSTSYQWTPRFLIQ